MSWYRRIKMLFTMGFVMFSYIAWTILSFILMKNKINFIVFIIALATVLIRQGIDFKKENKFWSLGMSSLIAAVMMLFAYHTALGLILNLVYVLCLNYYCYRIDCDQIDYFIGKEMLKKSIIVLVMLWIVSMISGFTINKSFFRFYIIYLVIGVIFLRQIREYTYNIVNKKSLIIDSIVTIGILTLSIDQVYNCVVKMLSIMKVGIDFLVERIIEVIVFILDKPLTYIIMALRERIYSNREVIDNTSKSHIFKNYKRTINNRNKVTSINDIVWLKNCFSIILLVIIVLVIFKIIMSLMYSHSKLQNAKVISEEKEKIKDDVTNKKDNIFNKLIKRMIILGNPREKVKYTYKQFQKVAKDRKLFKYYMTAGQLKNSVNINTNIQDEELRYITDSYNEAKFSTHPIYDDKAARVQKDFYKIKNKI